MPNLSDHVVYVDNLLLNIQCFLFFIAIELFYNRMIQPIELPMNQANQTLHARERIFFRSYKDLIYYVRKTKSLMKIIWFLMECIIRETYYLRDRFISAYSYPISFVILTFVILKFAILKFVILKERNIDFIWSNGNH